MLMGVNPCTIFILPMLDKHPDEYPRFRDCFLANEEHPEYDDYIHVYTRVGGGNRGCGKGEEELMKLPNFITTFDDSFDSTYATYVFSVPDRWQDDFKKIRNGQLKEVSTDYQNKVREVFPKLKDKLDLIWGI